MSPFPQRRKSDRAASAYFDFALTGIVDSDRGGSVLRANPAAASITGHDLKRLNGARLDTLVAPASAAAWQRHQELLLEQGISQTEVSLLRADGQEIIATFNSVQVDDGLYVHVFDDVTEERRATAELERARAEAEAANLAKTNFLAGISHEIRTPMNGILGLARLALMTGADERQRGYLEKIVQSGRTLLQILNDLLDYAKIEAGRVEYEQIEFSLDELLDELAALASPRAADMGLEIVFRVAPDVPPRLVGDRLRLGQCLANLFGNALKFTPAGTVALEVAVTRRHEDGVDIRFLVSDTGIGIAPEARERLFRPFSQADATTTRRFGGTGLGLAIARDFAVGMGGDLTVDSEPGSGSRFALVLPFRCASGAGPAPAPAGHARVAVARPATRQAVAELLAGLGWTATATAERPAAGADPCELLVLDGADGPPPPGGAAGAALMVLGEAQDDGSAPAADPARRVVHVPRPVTPRELRRALQRLEPAAAAPAAVPAAEIPEDFRGARILVAEDNPVNQILLLDLLRLAGIQTTLAENGLEALAHATAPGAAPDLVLMDVHMPEMDGLAATRQLRARGHRFPIIGVSAGALREAQEACLAAGMNDVLLKPIDVDELWGVLTRWVPPRPAAGQARAETAEERFGGKVDILGKARRLFIETHRDDAGRLRARLLAEDLGGLAAAAHALRGAAATVGADRVAELARDLEMQAATAGRAQLLQWLGEAEEALAGFVARHAEP